jgi:AraC-like DNA-binding protein
MEAKRELKLTSKTVKEIAYDLGFNDEYHFSRYFKNKIKVSPQLYRSSLRNARDRIPQRKLSIILGSLAIVTAIF